jgi:hypothetical protein
MTGVWLKSEGNHKTFINTHFKNEDNKIGLLIELLKSYTDQGSPILSSKTKNPAPNQLIQSGKHINRVAPTGLISHILIFV